MKNESAEINIASDFSHEFKYKKSVGHYIGSTLMMIFAIIWIQHFLFGSIVLGLGSIIFLGYRQGIEIDFKQRKYRDVYYFGNIGFGNWKFLPEIKYVSVFRTIITSGVTGRSGASITTKERVILVNLIHGKNQIINVFKTEDVDEAFKKAEIISTHLNVKIYDATERKGKWFNEQTVLSKEL